MEILGNASPYRENVMLGMLLGSRYELYLRRKAFRRKTRI